MVSGKEKIASIIKSKELGVSFSVLNCTEYDIDWRDALHSTINLGFKRFRMMSYWSEIENEQGAYNFSYLDEQLEIVKEAGGRVSLAIGIKQPRWPETHVPKWTKGLSKQEITEKYLAFHTAVVDRYKDYDVIESWQLENEFWLRGFGKHFDYSRSRLKKEFQILRDKTPHKPIIMSVVGLLTLPLFSPTPDLYAFSIYRINYNYKKKRYSPTFIRPWMLKTKRYLIKITKRRDVIVHELQAEPWGPEANWNMSIEEQNKSMNPERINDAVEYSLKTGITYADMWGAEWWYWRSTKFNDTTLNKAVVDILSNYPRL